jgi:F0F1-type ATP synthase assembly protein I
MGRFAHFGFQLAAAIGVFLAAGWWLDGKIGTKPLFTIVGALFGAATAIYSMIRQLMTKSGDTPGATPGGQGRER